MGRAGRIGTFGMPLTLSASNELGRWVRCAMEISSFVHLAPWRLCIYPFIAPAMNTAAQSVVMQRMQNISAVARLAGADGLLQHLLASRPRGHGLPSDTWSAGMYTQQDHVDMQQKR